MRLKLILLISILIFTACTPTAQQDMDVVSAPQAESTTTSVSAAPAVPSTEQTPPSLPTAPETESTLSAADCAGADIRQMADSIAEDYPFTSGEEVMAWFCEGAEFEDILVALESEDLTHTPAEEMLAMLAEGLNWEEIWQVIGLTKD